MPGYKYGTEIAGSRNIQLAVDTGTETKYYDQEGNETTDTEAEGVTSKDVPYNAEEDITVENYRKTKAIIEDRLHFLKIYDYTIRLNEENGEISIDIPEDNQTDSASQYSITPGVFQILDADTSDVLLTNADVKSVSVDKQQNTNGSYTVYFDIRFKDAKKFEEITRAYTTTTDAEGNKTDKNIEMKIDSSSVLTTSFSEPILNGVLQLSAGTATTKEELEVSMTNANNIAVFIGTDSMPLKYTMEVNRLVYSDITEDILNIVAIVGLILLAVMMVLFIFKYKVQGLFAGISLVGFTAALLLIIRLASVSLSVAGLGSIGLSVLIDALTLYLLCKARRDKAENENAVTEIIVKLVKVFIPLMIVAVAGGLSSSMGFVSFGLVLFWGLIINIIFNFFTAKVMVLDTYKTEREIKREKAMEERSKKEETKKPAKKEVTDTKKSTKKTSSKKNSKKKGTTK
jgi:large-conductance mechanosensitive channel